MACDYAGCDFWTGPGAFTSRSATPNVTAPGTYTLTVNNPANGCSNTDTVTVTQPPELTLSAAKTDITCNAADDGTIAAIPIGGRGPYRFKMDGGAFQSI